MSALNILAIGDVVGEVGVAALEKSLRKIKSENQVDFTIVNGENAAGVGITAALAHRIYTAGADVITLGNHVWGKRDIARFLDEDGYILRPANLADLAPGRGHGIFQVKSKMICVINLIGRCGMDFGPDNPFTCVSKLLRETARLSDFTVIDFHANATSEKIAMAYHVDGKVSALWEIAVWTKELFLKMADFFNDEGETYKIFARARKCHCSGGVAGIRSYTYIYDPENLPEFEALKFLFAHEMVHNWVQLNDKPYGTCTWYVEGMAEYYSLVLPWRFGLVTREEVKHQLESRIKQYYENPCRLLPNQQLGNLLFQDLEATDVPYGRGMFYLMQVDKRIREKTNGIKNLDCVMKRMQEKVKENENAQNLVWIKAVEEETGLDEMEYLLLLSQGELILPEFSCFEGAGFEVEECDAVARRSEEACKSYIVK